MYIYFWNKIKPVWFPSFIALTSCPPRPRPTTQADPTARCDPIARLHSIMFQLGNRLGWFVSCHWSTLKKMDSIPKSTSWGFATAHSLGIDHSDSTKPATNDPTWYLLSLWCFRPLRNAQPLGYPQIIHVTFGFSLINHLAIGYPHGYGTPQILMIPTL